MKFLIYFHSLRLPIFNLIYMCECIVGNLRSLIISLDDRKLANFCRILAVTISDLDIYENKSSCKFLIISSSIKKLQLMCVRACVCVTGHLSFPKLCHWKITFYILVLMCDICWPCDKHRVIYSMQVTFTVLGCYIVSQFHNLDFQQSVLVNCSL